MQFDNKDDDSNNSAHQRSPLHASTMVSPLLRSSRVGLVVCLALSLSPVTQAMAVPKQQRTVANHLIDSGTRSPVVDTQVRRATRRKLQAPRVLPEEQEEEEILMYDRLLDRKAQSNGPFISDLASSTTEVPDDKLMEEMDNARDLSPDGAGRAFVNAHVKGATNSEKSAMSRAPMQLPQPAVKALVNPKAMTLQQKVKYTGWKQRQIRLTPSEELELAEIVQIGVPLHHIKSEYEARENRAITKQEWARLCGIEPRELRRMVAEYRSAKQTLVAANMGLVSAVVKRVLKPGDNENEMVQEGSLGLMRAAELFDPSRGLRFSTYATIWIKGVLSNANYLRGGMIKMPVREKTKWHKIRAAQEELTKKASNPNYVPTNAEVAKVLGMQASEVEDTCRRVFATQSVMSLDHEYQTQSRGGDEHQGFEAVLNSKSTTDDSKLAEYAEMRADVVAALVRNLDAREARLIRLRYGLKDGIARTIPECAELMGLSHQTVKSLTDKCLKKLREADDAESLQEYLQNIV